MEETTKETFDLNNRRHFFLLQENIKRYYSEPLRKLALIENVMSSNNGENDVYNRSTSYLRNR